MIHWIRHGQSTWNAAGRLQGHTAHPPLTALGRRQAVATAERLATLPRPPGLLLTSPAVRARQTAEVIAARLGLTAAIDERLIEKGLREDWRSVTDRVRAIVAGLDPDREPVVVTHGDIIAVASRLSCGEPVRPPFEATVANGAIVSL